MKTKHKRKDYDKQFLKLLITRLLVLNPSFLSNNVGFSELERLARILKFHKDWHMAYVELFNSKVLNERRR